MKCETYQQVLSTTIPTYIMFNGFNTELFQYNEDEAVK